MSTGLRPGVHCIAATPFMPDEALDLASIDTLIDYLVRCGCDGSLVLGVLGEADKLSDGERDQVIARTIEQAGDRLQVSVGITHGYDGFRNIAGQEVQVINAAIGVDDQICC